MSHPNALKQLKTYGPLAVKLARLDDAVDAIWQDRKKYQARLARFIEFCQTPEVKNLIIRLHHDTYGANRTTAASSMLHLWESQNLIPYHEDEREQYDRDRRAHSNSLAWTIPLLLEALADRQEGPIHHAILVARYLDDTSDEVRQTYREALLAVGHSRYKNIRLTVVRELTQLYPSNDDAQHILDEAGLRYLLDATRDPYIKVRDWACFELHCFVANLGDEAEVAFRERLAQEDPDSNVYIEALTGLARLTDDLEVTRQICARFDRDDDFGSGWIDAVEQSKQADCLLALIAAHQRILAKYPNDPIIQKIERVFTDWNEEI